MFLNQLTVFSFVTILLLSMMTACASSSVQPVIFSSQYQVGDTFMEIRLHGTIELPPIKVNGIKLAELSGLSWDEDDGILYAVSDQGNLFHLQAVITNHTLTSAVLLAAYPLRDETGKQLRPRYRDAEGLAIIHGNNGIKGDSQLLISFEGIPSIALFTPTGKLLKRYTLPKPLQNVKNYVNSNKALESVTIHPQFGILTAPEWPLKENKGKIVIYSLAGPQWSFPPQPAPNSAVVALEALDDGSVLVLERAWVSIWQPLIISLRRVWLSPCEKCAGHINTNVKVKQVVEFDSSQGWNLDNFEGLTRHQGSYFFMVSDDNESSWQRTLLSYFEIIDN
jgi:hypothetical protein